MKPTQEPTQGAPKSTRHLTLIPGERAGHASQSFSDHPVHGSAAVRRIADEIVRSFADADEHPFTPRLAASVLFVELGKLRAETDWAVCDNAMQDLAAYFSTSDDCNPQGIPRP